MSAYVPELELTGDVRADVRAVVNFLQYLDEVGVDEEHPEEHSLAADRLLQVAAWAARYALFLEREGHECALAKLGVFKPKPYPPPAPGECGHRSPQGVPCRLAAGHEARGHSEHEGHGERW